MKLAPVLNLTSKAGKAASKRRWWRFWSNDELHDQIRPESAIRPATLRPVPPRPTSPIPPSKSSPPFVASAVQGPSGILVPARLPPMPVPPPRTIQAAFTRPATVPVRAIAVAHEHANAVGTVELSTGPLGLHLNFLRISSYADGYVPYPVTSSQKLTIAFEQVARVLVDQEGIVHLTLDPTTTPHNRLALAGLTKDTAFDQVVSYRRRARIQRDISLTALCSWLPIAGAIHLVSPSMPAALVGAIAITLSGLVHSLRGDIAAKIVLFGAAPLQVRGELLAELAFRLGPSRIIQEAQHTPEPVEATAEPNSDNDSPETSNLRYLFTTASVVAAVALVAIVLGKILLSANPSKDDYEALAPIQTAENLADLAARTIQSAQAPPIAADTPRPRVELPACSCSRSDSALWSDGIPKLSVLTRNRPGKTSKEKPSVYPEIAVVNNASVDLENVVLVVDFVVGPQAGRKARVVDRQDLFWEGKLKPGQAVKWRVKGRGDDFNVTSFADGRLGDSGIQPAPADAFYELLTAHTPSVRLHGATMLAWMGDFRAKEALDKLRNEGHAEMGPTLDMLGEAIRPLRVCDIHASKADQPGRLTVQACVFNGSREIRQRPVVVARTHQDGSTTEARWSIETDIAASAGVVTSAVVDLGDVEAKPDEAQIRIGVEP